MIPLFDDPALAHHDNVVGISDGGESVGDHNGGDGSKVLTDLINGALDLFLVLLVQCTSSFIKKEDLWLLNKCSCDSDSLLLPTGELATSTANVCVDAFGAHLLLDESPCISSF
jgi:hypothetical protein